MSEKTTRRALLSGTAAASLVGLAGCASVMSSSSGDAAGKTGSPSDAGEAGGSGSSNSSDEPLMHASDEKTNFGIDLSGNPVMGSKDAPVTMYYWTDFQCPFCNRFEQNALPKLTENLVAQDELRVVVLEFPNIGEASKGAARMAKCVWRQVRSSDPDAYNRWHSTVFDAQEEPNSGWAKKDNLYTITDNVMGVDADEVKSCMQENRDWAQSHVDDDLKSGNESGISATPGFILANPETGEEGKIVGAQPYDRFKSAIDKVKNA